MHTVVGNGTNSAVTNDGVLRFVCVILPKG